MNRMRQPLFKTRNTQDVCFFCLTRLELFAPIAIRRPAHPQRRLLQSSSSIKHPTAAAAQLQYDEPNILVAESASVDTPSHQTQNIAPNRPSRFGSGWAKGPSTIALTAEEQRQRDGLRATKSPVKSVVRLSAPRLGQDSPSKRPNIRTTPRLPFSIHGKTPRRQKDIAVGPRIERLRREQKRTSSNTGAEIKQRPNGVDMPSKAATGSDETEQLSNEWRHIRRRSRVVAKEEGVVPQAEQPRDLREARREQEQSDRMRRTADGAFVGFRPLKIVKPPSSSSLAREVVQEFNDPPPISRTDSPQPEPATHTSAGNRRLEDGKAQTSGHGNLVRSVWSRDSPGGSEELLSSSRATLGNFSKSSESEGIDIDVTDGNRQPDQRRPLVTVQAAKPFIDDDYTPARSVDHLQKLTSRNFERRGQVGHRRRIEEDEDDGEYETMQSRMERKRQRKREKLAQRATAPPIPILLPEFISVGNLATVLHVRVEDFRGRLRRLGFDDVDYDYVLDGETAGLIAVEFNYEPMVDQSETSEDLVALPPVTDVSLLQPRPPVITIMGHVDHGKTTLLDWLRKSSVAASEHGGITQHIGAFTVPMPSGKIITFLDTPGHAAFLNMRQRGANVTDIVILVIAADDSVKPQTVEAIKHAKAAQVPIIVAVNKIDKEDSNVERVKQDLARHGIDVEDYGGDTQVVCVSGKTGQGMEELEDAAITLADVLDLRAQATGQIEGWVLEATTKKGGRVATVLVRRGTLVPGTIIVAGSTWARVRSLRNEAGLAISKAGPGVPVEIDGWREQPSAGDEVLQAVDEQQARKVVEHRLERTEKARLAADVIAVNEARKIDQVKRDAEIQAAKQVRYGGSQSEKNDTPATVQDSSTILTEVPFLLRADASGSVEAVQGAILALGNAEVRASLLRSAVGAISKSDVEHAAAAQGHIINFSQPVDGQIARLAETSGVKIFDNSVIYRLVDDVKNKLEESLPELKTQRVLGEAEVAQIFDITVTGRVGMKIAGCRVRNGVVAKAARIRVLRGRESVYDGTLSSLKNIKKDVSEMRKGGECGMGFDGFSDMEIGDQVQSYEEVSEKRFL